MNDLAIVVCNWNKQEDVIKCLDSVNLAVPPVVDVIVVDNASTDGSVKALENYRERPIRFIKNSVNLGGTGGFNTALRKALSDRPKYVHLLDNDIIVDKQTFRSSYELLEKEPSIGAVGSKIYQLDHPDKTQELGARIDWFKCQVDPLNSGVSDSTLIPSIVDSDYVPACSVMIRSELILEFGLMREDYFLYWDDVEWFSRLRKSGKKVVAYDGSKVWHKMGVKKRENTSGTYYFQRNRIHFFIHNTNEKNLDHCIETIFEDLFQSYYFSRIEGKFNTAKTVLRAVIDGLAEVRGKAPEGRIRKCEDNPSRFVDWFSNQKGIFLHAECSEKTKADVMEVINEVNPTAIIPNNQVLIKKFAENTHQENFLPLKIVNHVSELTSEQIKSEVCFVDRFFNLVSTPMDRRRLSQYEYMLKNAQKKFLPQIKLQVRKLRSNGENSFVST